MDMGIIYTKFYSFIISCYFHLSDIIFFFFFDFFLYTHDIFFFFLMLSFVVVSFHTLL